MRRRRALLVAGALLAAISLAACGEKKDTVAPAAAETQPLNLMLDWLPNADHVGIYEAQADGGFAKAGLKVHIQVPTDPATPLQLLAAGKVDAAISYEPQLMLARDAGEPLVAIAALVQRPLTSIVSLHSKHISSPQDLRGKTIGNAGIPYQQAYLKTILAHAGVPEGSVKDVNVGANLVPAMLSGRVAATLGAYYFQGRISARAPNLDLPVAMKAEVARLDAAAPVDLDRAGQMGQPGRHADLIAVQLARQPLAVPLLVGVLDRGRHRRVEAEVDGEP